ISVLASVGLVWVTYRLARLAVDRPVARLAAALTALSPYQLMYAQEARTYALVALWTTLALFLFARAVLFHQPRAWLPFVLASGVGVGSEVSALLVVGVQLAVLLVWREAGRHLLPWLRAQLMVMALSLPWLFVSVAQAKHLSSSHWYLTAPGEHSIVQVLRAV